LRISTKCFTCDSPAGPPLRNLCTLSRRRKSFPLRSRSSSLIGPRSPLDQQMNPGLIELRMVISIFFFPTPPSFFSVDRAFRSIVFSITLHPPLPTKESSLRKKMGGSAPPLRGLFFSLPFGCRKSLYLDINNLPHLEVDPGCFFPCSGSFFRATGKPGRYWRVSFGIPLTGSFSISSPFPFLCGNPRSPPESSTSLTLLSPNGLRLLPSPFPFLLWWVRLIDSFFLAGRGRSCHCLPK